MIAAGGTDAIDAVATSVTRRAADLVALSHAVHGDDELAFEEHVSSARVAHAADAAGFDVLHGTAGLDTAVVATYGSGPVHVGICAEYDALPGIGHACGHNVIAAAAVGAALGLAEVADDVGLTVRLLGTPAEENGGGKVLMLRAGSFDGLHAAMMVHPAAYESPSLACLAVTHVPVVFEGESAHASAYPERGRNAADALTVAQVGIGLLRQHLPRSARVHGIVTDGGDAPNVVPQRAGGTWYVRARSLTQLEELYPRVRACFEAGALATGTRLRIADPGPAYSEFVGHPGLEERYATHTAALGRSLTEPCVDTTDEVSGSTDMANVSLELPTIHPMLDIGAGDAVNHQPGFTKAAAAGGADRAVIDGAIAMAATAVDAATRPEVRDDLLGRGGYDSTGFEVPVIA